MERLCKEVYTRDESKRLRQRAMLCQIYHLALHDKWHQARDLMLMSHLQSIIDHSDISTQVCLHISFPHFARDFRFFELYEIQAWFRYCIIVRYVS